MIELEASLEDFFGWVLRRGADGECVEVGAGCEHGKEGIADAAAGVDVNGGQGFDGASRRPARVVPRGWLVVLDLKFAPLDLLGERGEGGEGGAIDKDLRTQVYCVQKANVTDAACVILGQCAGGTVGEVQIPVLRQGKVPVIVSVRRPCPVKEGFGDGRDGVIGAEKSGEEQVPPFRWGISVVEGGPDREFVDPGPDLECPGRGGFQGGVSGWIALGPEGSKMGEGGLGSAGFEISGGEIGEADEEDEDAGEAEESSQSEFEVEEAFVRVELGGRFVGEAALGAGEGGGGAHVIFAFGAIKGGRVAGVTGFAEEEDAEEKEEGRETEVEHGEEDQEPEGWAGIHIV